MSTLQRTRPKSQQAPARSRTVAETQTQTQTQTGTRAHVRSETQAEQGEIQKVTQAELVKHSVHVVKELVVAGLSCVAYLRGLFPESYFGAEKVLSAPKYSPPPGPHPPKPEITHVNIRKLKRDQSAQSNTVIDWIEDGLQAALETGWIAQLVVAVYLDPANPTNVVEAWRFKFDYSVDQDGVVIPTLEVTDQNNKPLPDQQPTVTNPDSITRSAQGILKSILTAAELMGDLPPVRYLNCRIIKTDSAPPDWDPPHFKNVDFATEAAVNFNLATAEDEPDTTSYGRLRSSGLTVGIDSVSIADHVTHLPGDGLVDTASALAFARTEAKSRQVRWDEPPQPSNAPEPATTAPAQGPPGQLTKEVERAPLKRLRRGNQRSSEQVNRRSAGSNSVAMGPSNSAALPDELDAMEIEGGEVEGAEVYGCVCGAGGAEGCTDVACSTCNEWWHGWCLGMGWDEKDEIPEVVECWTCDPRMREATTAAEGDEGRQKALVGIGAKLKRLAIKRRLLAIYFDFEHIMSHANAAAALNTSEEVVASIFKELQRERFLRLKRNAKKGEMPFAYNPTLSIDQYRHRTYFTPGKGVEAAIFAELDKMVAQWKTGGESQSVQAAPTSASEEFPPAAVATQVLTRRASLRHGSLGTPTSSPQTSLESDESSTPKASSINHRTSTTTSTTSTLAGLAGAVKHLALPVPIKPVCVEQGVGRKAPVVRCETASVFVEASQSDEIEDVEMGDEGRKEEDEIVGFENETMLWEEMSTQPALRSAPAPVASASATDSPVTAHSAEHRSTKGRALSTLNSQLPGLVGDRDDAVLSEASSARRAPSKPPPPPWSRHTSRAVPKPAQVAPAKVSTTKARKNTFRSPLLTKLPSPPQPSLPRAPPVQSRLSVSSASQRLERLMKADSLIEDEAETALEPDTQLESEPEHQLTTAAGPKAQELVEDTPPSSASSDKGPGPVPQPAQMSSGEASTVARKREAEDEIDEERDTADEGGGVAAERQVGGLKRRRVGMSAPIFLCFTKKELGIAEDDDESD